MEKNKSAVVLCIGSVIQQDLRLQATQWVGAGQSSNMGSPLHTWGKESLSTGSYLIMSDGTDLCGVAKHRLPVVSWLKPKTWSQTLIFTFDTLKCIPVYPRVEGCSWAHGGTEVPAQAPVGHCPPFLLQKGQELWSLTTAKEAEDGCWERLWEQEAAGSQLLALSTGR